MTDIEKKILTMARQHSSFDEGKAVAEIETLRKLDIDLAPNLWGMTTSKIQGSENNCNSYLAYYLGITTKSPEGNFQLEERRTYGRSGFPDIDMDFDYEKRQDIIDYLVKTYGRDCVGNIGANQTFKTKNAIRRAIKVLDPDNTVKFDKDGKRIKGDTNENYILEQTILNTLPEHLTKHDGEQIKSVKEAYEEYPEFAKYMKQYPSVYELSQVIEGMVSGFSCIAADTAVLTEHGYTRVDQLDNRIKLAYVNSKQEIVFTVNFQPLFTGIKKCYKLTLDDGSWVKLTDEHLVFTNKGCVEFKEIRKNIQNYKVWSIK